MSSSTTATEPCAESHRTLSALNADNVPAGRGPGNRTTDTTSRPDRVRCCSPTWERGSTWFYLFLQSTVAGGTSPALFPRRSVYAVGYDGPDAAPSHLGGALQHALGAELAWSNDLGRSLEPPRRPARPVPRGRRHVAAEHPADRFRPFGGAQRLYCGVEPSACSSPATPGTPGSLNNGLCEPPHRAKWLPGGGDLCWRTVARRSAGPTRRQSPSRPVALPLGRPRCTWAPRQPRRACRVPARPAPSSFGQCVHEIFTTHPARDRLFLRTGWASTERQRRRLLDRRRPRRSSDFGFCMAMPPGDPDTVVHRSIEPTDSAYARREAARVSHAGHRSVLAADDARPPAEGRLEMGGPRRHGDGPLSIRPASLRTRSGKVFGSRDEGRSWDLVHQGPAAGGRREGGDRGGAGAGPGSRAGRRQRGVVFMIRHRCGSSRAASPASRSASPPLSATPAVRLGRPLSRPVGARVRGTARSRPACERLRSTPTTSATFGLSTPLPGARARSRSSRRERRVSPDTR